MSGSARARVVGASMVLACALPVVTPAATQALVP